MIRKSHSLETVAIVQEYIPTYRVEFFQQLRHALKNRGVDLHVFAGRSSDSQESRADSECPEFVEPISQTSVRIAGKRLTIRNIKATLSADLLILEQSRRNLDAHFLLALPRALRPDIALWGHGRDRSKVPSPMEANLLRQMTRRADWLFTYTDQGRTDAIGLGCHPAQVTVVNNSRATGDLTEHIRRVTQTQIDQFVNEYFGMCWKSQPVVSFLGSLVPEKRIDLVLKTFEKISFALPETLFIMAGEGPEKRLVHEARNSGLRIASLGYAGAREKAIMSHISRCLILPSHVGLVTIDSFAMGVPIITKRQGQHGPEIDYLVDGVNSKLTVGDTTSLATAAVGLLQDVDEAERLRMGAFASLPQHSIEAMVDNFTQGVLSALQRTRRS